MSRPAVMIVASFLLVASEVVTPLHVVLVAMRWAPPPIGEDGSTGSDC